MKMSLAALALSLFAVPTARAGEDAEECKKALEAFRTAYKSQDDYARTGAVTELGKHKCEKSQALLIGLLTKDHDPIRVAAAQALAEFDSLKAVVALGAAIEFNLDEKEVVDALVKALEKLDYEAGALTLNTFLKRYNDKKVSGALESIVEVLGKLGSPSSVDPLIDLLSHAENAGGASGGRRSAGRGGRRGNSLEKDVEKALEEITGHREDKPDKWKEWWKTNSPNLLAKRILVYRCKATGQRWEQKAGEPVKCPNHQKPESDGQVVKTKLH